MTAGGFRFPATIFLSAFLLFQVQPILARYLLPWFGGSPAVWTTCVLFFQAVLLAGYAYAHWMGSRRWLHAGLIAVSLLFLPIGPSAAIWKPGVSGGDPAGRILLLLAVTAGVPYFLLSSTAPLVQRWFHQTQPEAPPWRLYALSNLGSFLALLSYPFAVEPFVRLRTQAWVWSGLYVVFAALCAWSAWSSRRPEAGRAPAAGFDPAPPSPWTVAFWLGLSAGGSTLLLAATNQISQEIAVNPFLWIAPLSVYLLTFVLTFESPRWYRRGPFAVAAGLLAAATCAVLSAAVALSIWTQIAVYLATLYVTCMVCHGELVQSKPAPRYLTTFYLTVAAGGALGGVFVALIAPRVFTEFSEFPIGLAAACLLGLAGCLRSGGLAQWTSHNLAVRLPVIALLFGGFTAVADTVIAGSQPAAASRRNFYGILRVTGQKDDNGPLRRLTHGRTDHGFQYLDADKRRWPTMYYGPHSGVARALNAIPGDHRSIAVIGLGAGTLAAWGRPDDVIRFYEINPEVVNIANTWFTFLKDSPARTEVVLGDARIQLERELEQGRSQDFDTIAVDAFSSDSIPIHLLTAECGDIYRRRLKPGGLLLLHISNRVLNLEPVARGLARHLGWKAAMFFSEENDQTGEKSSRWVLITSNTAFLEQPEIAGEIWSWTRPERPPITWTDDFASLWHVLKL